MLQKENKVSKCKNTNIVIAPKKTLKQLSCEIFDGWISQSYGLKIKSPILTYKIKSNLDEDDLNICFEIKEG